ncbi:MAG: chemotaxis protein CheW [Pseudomonadota bacterium]
MDAAEISETDLQYQNQYLTFELGEEEYAIDILSVQEIKSWGPVTPLPKAPDYLLGVINLRGAIIPVIDLRRRFALPAQEICGTTTVVIVNAQSDAGAKVVGLVVDSVSEVYHLTDEQIQQSSNISGEIDATLIQGLAKINDKLVILLNLDRLVLASIGVEAQVESDT